MTQVRLVWVKNFQNISNNFRHSFRKIDLANKKRELGIDGEITVARVADGGLAYAGYPDQVIPR